MAIYKPDVIYPKLAFVGVYIFTSSWFVRP